MEGASGGYISVTEIHVSSTAWSDIDIIQGCCSYDFSLGSVISVVYDFSLGSVISVAHCNILEF